MTTTTSSGSSSNSGSNNSGSSSSGSSSGWNGSGLSSNNDSCGNNLDPIVDVGDRVMVSFDPPDPNTLRSRPSSSGERLRSMPPGTEMTILDGPYCNRWNYWHVRLADGTTGYTAGGDHRNHWLVPVVNTAPRTTVYLYDSGWRSDYDADPNITDPDYSTVQNPGTIYYRVRATWNFADNGEIFLRTLTVNTEAREANQPSIECQLGVTAWLFDDVNNLLDVYESSSQEWFVLHGDLDNSLDAQPRVTLGNNGRVEILTFWECFDIQDIAQAKRGGEEYGGHTGSYYANTGLSNSHIITDEFDIP